MANNHWWIPKSANHPFYIADGTYDPTTDGPPAGPPAGQVMRYGARQRKGAELRRWIKMPLKPNCPIFPNTLTIQNIPRDWYPQMTRASPRDNDYASILHHLSLPPMTQSHPNSAYTSFDTISILCGWRGFIGPGVIIIEDFHRRPDHTHHASEVSLAFYQTFHLIDTLQHIIFAGVVNQDTIDFLTGELYGERIDFSDDWWRSWVYGTPEYDALLATEIGKVVAAVVLGGFRRGTRRISRINTVCNLDGISAHMHFEIEIICSVRG